MAQHIRLILEDEHGKTVEQSDLNFAEIVNVLEKMKAARGSYPLLSSIDPFGDTIFNSLQLPSVIQELQKAAAHLSDKNLSSLARQSCIFLEKARKGVHLYAKFVGD